MHAEEFKLINENRYFVNNIEDVAKRDSKRNTPIEFKGESRTLAQWSRHVGVGSCTLIYRIRHRGMERAFTTPNMKGKRHGPY